MSTKFCENARTDCHYLSDGCCRSPNYCKYQVQVYDNEGATRIQLAYMIRVLRRLEQVQKQLNVLKEQVKKK